MNKGLVVYPRGMRHEYTEAFFTIKEAFKDKSHAMSDALTHEAIIYKLHYPDGHIFIKFSFNAVISHIKYELNNMDIKEKPYLEVFSKYSFCKRMMENKPI